MALTLLIYSACMPFMILTYLLRGIDLPTIFAVLALGYMYSAFVNALGIFAGSISGSWLLRGLVAAGMLFMLIYMAVSFIVMVNVSLSFGMGMVFTGDVLEGSRHQFYLWKRCLIGVLYVFAVANLSPKPANRMFVPRIYITLAWLAAGLVAVIWAVATSEEVPILMWVVFSTAAFCIMAVVSLGERDAWTTRVRRVIPQKHPRQTARLLVLLGSGRRHHLEHDTVLDDHSRRILVFRMFSVAFQRITGMLRQRGHGVRLRDVLLSDDRFHLQGLAEEHQHAEPFGNCDVFGRPRQSGSHGCRFPYRGERRKKYAALVRHRQPDGPGDGRFRRHLGRRAVRGRLACDSRIGPRSPG